MVEIISFTREVSLKQTRDTICTKARFIGADVMHSESVEWLPASMAPSGGDVELCVLDYDGIVHALVFPCHKDGAEWVDASGKKQLGIQPTHWRKWTARH